MPGLPDGTVTFFFTDIEGSTRRWEEHPKTMGRLLAQHDAILRRAIESHGGAVFKTVGDAFCAAFRQPQAALDAALSAQLSLCAEDWSALGGMPVRMALHTGTAELRDDDYFGPALNRVARLLAAGHGGQVLLSRAIEQLVRDALPPGASLRDLGEHDLRDLKSSERVFQLVHPALACDFAPLRTAAGRRRLPQPPTSFVGRDEEVASALDLLRADTRLLTLTGPGGTGKTRLAIEIALQAADWYEDGACFVPLSTVRDAAGIIPAIAQSLDVREGAGRSLDDTLHSYLAAKRLLLVLDNLEQIDGAAPVVAALLETSVAVQVLTTSRGPLRVYGEREMSVAPMTLAESSEDPANALQSDAVRLFVDRAGAANARFVLDGSNVLAVKEICRRLDGLPLALELAAARVRVLPPETILARMDQRLRLLVGGERDRPERQQTMRAAIAWSHDLLEADERTLFRRLAVFEGGCTLEAVEAVAAEALATDTLDLIDALVGHSLLRPDESSGELRFTMLETVREYARERLQESGEGAAISERHAAYMLPVAQQASAHLWSREQLAWLARLDAEHANMRAALRWLVEHGDVDRALVLVAMLARFWVLRSHLTEGQAWFDQVMAMPIDRSPGTTRALAFIARGGVLEARGLYPEARGAYEESLQLYTEAGDAGWVGRARTGIAWTKWYEGRWPLNEIREGLEESVTLLRAQDGAGELADALHFLGHVVWDTGADEDARSLFEESLALYRSIGHGWGLAQPLRDLATMAARRRDFHAARPMYEESLALLRQIGDTNNIADTLGRISELHMREGRFEEAENAVTEAITLSREQGNIAFVVECMNRLAHIAAAQRDDQRAVQLYEDCLALARSIDNQRLIAAMYYNLAQQCLAAGELRRASDLTRESIRNYQAAARDLGIGACLAMFGALSAATGDRLAAVQLFAAADAMNPRHVESFDQIERLADHADIIDGLRDALGADEFAAAWVAGRALSTDEAMALALGDDMLDIADRVTETAD